MNTLAHNMVENSDNNEDLLYEELFGEPLIDESQKAIHVMNIDELRNIEIKSLEDISTIEHQLAYYRRGGSQFLYRGHSDCSYKLLPSIARLGHTTTEHKEKFILSKLIKILDKEEYNKYKLLPFNKDLFYLGAGRHLGLSCRLLDWTSSIWVALSFLLYDNSEKDGELWIMIIPDCYNIEKTSPLDIHDKYIHILKECYYIPNDAITENGIDIPIGIKRRKRQYGHFTATSFDLLHTPLNEIPDNRGIMFLHYRITTEVKKQLIRAPNIIDIDKWLYITDKDEIIEQVRNLNNLYNESEQ